MPQSRKPRRGEASKKLKLLREDGALASPATPRQGAPAPAATRKIKAATVPRTASVREGDVKLAKYRESASASPAFRFIDLFAGIGGMRLGFERAGGQCVFS